MPLIIRGIFFVLSIFYTQADIRLMIHISRLDMLMQRTDAQKRRVPFSMKFVKLSTGEIITVKEAVCTSSYHANRTFNIMFLPSLQVRKILKVLIIEFNGNEVYY